MMLVEAVIFDCDGVMFESRQANLAYYNIILAKFGYPVVDASQIEKAHLCHTASSPVVLATLMEARDLDEALSFADTVDYCEFIPLLVPEPNLTELLNQLSGQYKLAVATNRGHSIHTILDHFGLEGYFSVVVSRCEVENPKPAPDMLLLAAKQLNVKVERAVFIGDSKLDKMAANSAKIPFFSYGDSVSSEVSISNHLELLHYLN